MGKIRVLVVDDHPFFRSGLAQWLNQQERVICCGEAGSVVEARRAVAELQPDVVLMDLRLGDGEGLELIRELAPQQPQLRIVALSQFDENKAVYRNLWVKMALSSRRQASPLRVATGGDASWRPEARHRRSPAFCRKAWSPAAAIGGQMPAGPIALHFLAGTRYPGGSPQNPPTDSADETKRELR